LAKVKQNLVFQGRRPYSVPNKKARTIKKAVNLNIISGRIIIPLSLLYKPVSLKKLVATPFIAGERFIHLFFLTPIL
jgi:hypothetical protein